MRLYTGLLMGFLLALSVVSVVSCSNDKCRTVNCVNGGVCADGACTCSPGYEGPLCETRSRDRYIKTWTVWDSGSIAPIMIYTISVTADTLVTNLKIQNLYNYFTGYVRGTINSDDSLMLPIQTLMTKQLQGMGGYDTSTRFFLNYAVRDPSGAGFTDFRTIRSL